MRITDLLDARSILLNASPKSKNEALDQIVDLMVKSEKINDKEAYRKQVYAREEESTTGIGEGIAIPHGKCDAVTKPGLAAMVVKDGVDFDSLDGEPVTLMFLIAAPNTEDNIHLDVLSKLSVLLMNEEFTEALRNAETVEEFMGIINDADEKEAGIDERLAGEGAVLIAENGEVYSSPAPKGTLVNGVGAGDSMVAGFMTGWMEKRDYEHAFRMGVATGSASAFSEYLATRPEVEEVYKQLM